MNEEIALAAHLIGINWIQVEGAGTGHSGVHSIFAPSKPVLGRRERPIDVALLLGVHIAGTLTTVAVRIDAPFP